MAQYDTIRTAGGVSTAAIDEGLRAHMSKVYGTMSVGMLITFAVAWAVGTAPALLGVFRDPITLQPNILGWIVMFAPLGMIFGFGAMINRFSAAAAQTFFYAFAAVMGLSIAWIFVAFTGVSIAQIFLITSIAFASLSLYGSSPAARVDPGTRAPASLGQAGLFPFRQTEARRAFPLDSVAVLHV